MAHHPGKAGETGLLERCQYAENQEYFCLGGTEHSLMQSHKLNKPDLNPGFCDLFGSYREQAHCTRRACGESVAPTITGASALLVHVALLLLGSWELEKQNTQKTTS